MVMVMMVGGLKTGLETRSGSWREEEMRCVWCSLCHCAWLSQSGQQLADDRWNGLLDYQHQQYESIGIQAAPSRDGYLGI